MINKTEFEDYVNSFHKPIGSFTEDEIIQIGLKYRELSDSKKRDWLYLKELLGLSISTNALRCRINRYISKMKLIESKKDEAVNESASENIQKEKEAQNQYSENFVELQKVRDWTNAYKRDLREETRIQNLKDEISNAADKFCKSAPLLPVYHQFTSTDVNPEKEAVLLFSDLHIGVDCSNYRNTYNIDIAKKRVEKLVEKTITYCNKNNVQILHFLNLGDMIDGLIHTNARIEAQYDVAEQIIQAGELISEALSRLQYAAPEIDYYSVLDNHSRAIANKKEHIEKEQFSRVIDWFIKERLKDTKIVFKENTIDLGIGNLTLQNGRNCVFVHGHQDDRNSCFQNMVGLTKQWVDYIFLAHYHNPAVKEYQGCKVFINGSIVGTESYAFGRRLFANPEQKLLIFDTNDNDVMDIDIELED